MLQFSYLETILFMDFTLLRSNQGKATDEALHLFITNINGFFSQITSENRPSAADAARFNGMMREILEGISQAEYDYYLRKYSHDPSYADCTVADVEMMANAMKITQLSKLTTRMQYWAATEEYGGCIRNPREHRHAVKYIDQWVNSAGVYPITFFAKSNRRATSESILGNLHLPGTSY